MWYVQCRRILFGDKNEVMILHTTWMNLKNHHTKLNKPDIKGQTLYDFISMKYEQIQRQKVN